MAKPESNQAATQTADQVADIQVAPPAPRLGTTVHVKVPEGVRLINNETGAYFPPDVATPVTVTVTTLRRLEDGDLLLA